MTYQLGQVVVISSPATTYTQQFRGERAAVTAIHDDEPFAYEVTFSNGYSLGFSEAEISPAGDQDHDEIHHPSHYTWLPNGVEVIDITELMGFNLGNVVKYVLRANHKHDEPLTDLRKAAWYINREIERMEAAQ